MRPAAQVFYLAVFALLTPAHTQSGSSRDSRASSREVCAIEPNAIVSDACASYATLDSLNEALSPSLKSITQTTDFFAFYRLNLFNKICPFWSDENGMCGNIACVVNTLDDEKDIPPIWRAEELSKLEGPKAAHPGRQLQKERSKDRPLQGTLGESVGESCVVEYDDECDERDYCLPEDESASAKGDYVSLNDNSERFTGYAGEGAHMVWDAIYRENCFPKDAPTSQPTSLAPGKNQAASDLRSVIRAGTQTSDMSPFDDECLEKRVFYRVISGMHASISTHICHDYLNQTTGTWGPNLQCYQDRLATHPDRVSNLYFNYALLLRAVAKLKTYLRNYTFCSGDPSQDADTSQKVLHLATSAASAPPIFDETLMFRDPHSTSITSLSNMTSSFSPTPSDIDLKEDFRHRFRNVSRLMDCVGCDKCRLWGKLQTVGYGTALKVLFEYDETKNGENPPLRRTELVALVNTLDRVSHSLRAIASFREMETASDPPSSSTAAILEEPRSTSASTKKREKEEGEEDNGVGAGYGMKNQRITPTPPTSISSSFDADANDDEDDEYDLPPTTSSTSALDAAKAELRLVWRTYIYVLKSWISFPRQALRILVVELSRLWSFWLGLPVPARSWEVKMLRREEL